MKERPILFSGEMVRAILDGRKTQTRRVIKPQPNSIRWCPIQKSKRFDGWEDEHGKAYPCPYGQTGDRLWVRETYHQHYEGGFALGGRPCYLADGHCRNFGGIPWKPSIFMPRWASRITLEIASVRVERVQDISEDEAKAEGIQVLSLQDANDTSAWWESAPGENQARTPVDAFRKLWNSINGKKYPWESNPWVWVIEFKKVEPA